MCDVPPRRRASTKRPLPSSQSVGGEVRVLADQPARAIPKVLNTMFSFEYSLFDIFPSQSPSQGGRSSSICAPPGPAPPPISRQVKVIAGQSVCVCCLCSTFIPCFNRCDLHLLLFQKVRSVRSSSIGGYGVAGTVPPRLPTQVTLSYLYPTFFSYGHRRRRAISFRLSLTEEE